MQISIEMDDKFEMIKDRIAHILRAKNLTATQFAEIMQIQPSNVSHILNGRNKPSLDFVTKLKEVFPEYSFDWIIMGKKPITTNDPNLFSKELNVNEEAKNAYENKSERKETILPLDFSVAATNIADNVSNDNNFVSEDAKLKQIIYVYEDHTFEVYNIRK